MLPIPCLSINAIKSASVSNDGGEVSPSDIYNKTKTFNFNTRNIVIN